MRDADTSEIPFTEEPPANMLAIFDIVQTELDK
jgi:hypothetical protein